jgi:lipoprotein-anchoring transpeptidase ErfK/SrfK
MRAALAHPRRPAWQLITLVVVSVAVLACGCAATPRTPAPAPATSRAPRDGRALPDKGPTTPTRAPESTRTTVAQARVGRVAVYESPGASAPRWRLANPQPSGAPLVFLVQQHRGGWLRALLPIRPNGSTGWIRSTDVHLSQHEFRIVVTLRAHRITVYQGARIIAREPIAVGTRQTPTPGGVYYTKELLQPPNPAGAYGPYAYGLSGFSNVLTSFAGGDGVIGIHGTNDPSLLGKDVSHGCIRMSNAGITKLAKLLPLGVPVRIQP